jgi:PEP-CTERM motif
MRKLTLSAIALAASTMIGSATSYADYIGSVWTGLGTNPGDPPMNATIANAPPGPPNSTFTVTSINFSVPDSTVGTVGAFLSLVPGNCTGPACSLPTIMNNSYFLINNAPGFLASVPSLNTANNVIITHDDGIQLFGSTDNFIINTPGPTSPTPDFGTMTVAQNITLSYGECCAGPAVLQANLFQVPVNNIPEPASLALLGVALTGFGVMRRRWRKTV